MPEKRKKVNKREKCDKKIRYFCFIMRICLRFFIKEHKKKSVAAVMRWMRRIGITARTLIWRAIRYDTQTFFWEAS